MARRIEIVLGIFFAAFCSVASAQPPAGCADLSWTNAAQRTDGTPLPIEELANTAVLWSTISSDPDTIAASADSEIVAAPATSTRICGFEPGEVFFVARHMDTAGLISEPSNVASKLFGQPPPEPPSDLRPSDPTVYAIIQTRDTVALLPVGTIDPTTPCDGTQSVNGRNVVPRAAVTFFGDVQPEVVVAECLPAP